MTAPTFNTGTWNTATLNDPAIKRGSWNTGTLNAPTINTPIMHRGSWATGSFTSPTVTTPTINQGQWNTGTMNDAVIARPIVSLGSWSSGTSTDPILTRPTANLGAWNTATLNDPAVNRPAMALGSWSTATMTGKVTVPAASFTRTELSAPAGRKSLQVVSATITVVAGSGNVYAIVPETGTLDGIDMSVTDTLAASDTNYLAITVTNLGQAGAGTTAMLDGTDANSTKTTGGSGFTTNAKRSLSLSTVGALAVTSGDRLFLQVTQIGTIANSVTFPVWLLRFAGTT